MTSNKQKATQDGRKSERKQAFVEHYVECGDALEAAKRAGYDQSPAALSVTASRLKRELSGKIDEAVRKRFTDQAPAMLSVLSELAANSTSDAVRHKAASDWLDRAGYKPVSEHADVSDKRTYQELVAQIRQIMPEETAQQFLSGIVDDNGQDSATH